MDALPHVVAAQPHSDGDVAHHRHPNLKGDQTALQHQQSKIFQQHPEGRLYCVAE